MTEEKAAEILAQVPPVPEGSTFQVEKVTTVSLPHPYCITPKHVAYAADHCGGMLGDAAIAGAEKQGARCGMRGCSLKLSQHETQVTLVVVIPPGTTNLNNVPGLHAYLLKVNERAPELGIQGYAFPSRRGVM